MSADDFCRLLHELVGSPRVQALWHISDRGMPVFAHTVDVALICLSAYPEWREQYPDFRLDVVLISCLLHDLTKVNARHGDGLSHSRIMTDDPALAAMEGLAALDEVQLAAGIFLDQEGIDHVWHAIAAHHGRWGKVMPETAEALLVHQADNYSATHHRIAPIDANDVLPFLQRGYRWAQIGELFGVGRAVVKARLQDACRAEGLRSSTELLDRWLARGTVRAGDTERIRQIERARYVVDFARRCPEALIEQVREILPRSAPELEATEATLSKALP